MVIKKMDYKSAIEKLTKYHQLHMMKYYDELSETEKCELLSQIDDIDFELLALAKQEDKAVKKGKIAPLKAMTIKEIDAKKQHFYEIGINEIKKGSVGAVLLAGGQGTRLGFDKPKGCFNIGVNKDIYIFEQIIHNIMDVVKKAGAFIPLFIMTSEINNQDTISFFEEHQYFGYNKEYVTFFVQEMAPAVDFDGNIYMENTHKVSTSPNGNGGWFSSMLKAGLQKKFEKDHIKWLNIFSVDNVLQRIADPVFVGATIDGGYVSGSKVVKKASPTERVGVLCLEDDKPSIVEYYEMTDEIINSRDKDGELLYNYGVILNYLFRVDKLIEISNGNMPVHVVEKKIPYMNENREFVKPTEPNGYKFETLVLDMIHMLDNCLSFEVIREHEFAPVKNATGVDSVETARALMQKNGIEI